MPTCRAVFFDYRHYGFRHVNTPPPSRQYAAFYAWPPRFFHGTQPIMAVNTGHAQALTLLQIEEGRRVQDDITF